MRGFSIIELLISIVLVAILSITAQAAWVNLASDANAGVVQSTAGALRSSVELIHQRAQLDGVAQEANACVGGKYDAGTQSCPAGGTLLRYGYPAAELDTLSELLNLDDWAATEVSIFPAGGIRIAPDDKALTRCYIFYRQATALEAPEVSTSVSNC